MPTSSFPAAGFLLSGVVMPMEVGAFKNCVSYAFAAATPLLEDPPLLLLLLLLLLPPPPALLLLLLLPPHAAMNSAEVTAMTAANVFLIRAPSGKRPGVPSSRVSIFSSVNVGLLSWFST
jgi:hypothetical protein